jgi:hypothetical protein
MFSFFQQIRTIFSQAINKVHIPNSFPTVAMLSSQSSIYLVFCSYSYSFLQLQLFTSSFTVVRRGGDFAFAHKCIPNLDQQNWLSDRPDWANFRPIGDFALGSLGEIREVAYIFRPLYLTVMFMHQF